MTTQAKRTRILLTASLLTGAASIVAWRFSQRWRMSVQETELDVTATQSSVHPLTNRDFEGDQPLQLLAEGQGPLYYRVYQVDILNPAMSKESLLQSVKDDLNHYTPGELAHFDKTKGAENEFNVGDEFNVIITGPWNGPVRVIDVQPTSFSFITLEGHLEAGEIQFRVCDHPDREDAYRFEIRSWARSSDSITDFFYRVVNISKFSQTRMWTYFCHKVVQDSGGEQLGKINVMTHKTHFDAKEETPLWKQYSSQFDVWRAAKLNFDPSKREDFTEKNGWHIDEYAIGLPSEAPGAPVPNGPWETARQIMLNYEFPDPSLVTGIFVPDNPLKDRIMVIRARFTVFTFLFGVRVSQVIDEQRDGGKRGKAQVWGYSYSTLTGHFEMGEITFEIWKFLESGEIEFRIHAYSKTGLIRNPFYRLGFRIWGRGLQRRFGHTALERMQQLVIQRVARHSEPETPIETPSVQNVRENESVQEKVEAIKADQAPAKRA